MILKFWKEFLKIVNKYSTNLRTNYTLLSQKLTIGKLCKLFYFYLTAFVCVFQYFVNLNFASGRRLDVTIIKLLQSNCVIVDIRLLDAKSTKRFSAVYLYK